MPINYENVLKAVKEARERAKKRNFIQSFELSVNLKDVDIKKARNKLQGEITFPHKFSKPVKLLMIADGELAVKAKNAGIDVIDKSEIEVIGSDKRKIRKLAKLYDYFLAKVDLMPLIAKFFGQVLGPRGKMPTPVPPMANIESYVDKYSRTVKYRVRDTPTINIKVGDEKMTDEQVAENIIAAINTIVSKLDRGFGNVKSMYVKLSMGPAAKIET
ncbi:MAG: 50S ribosomal protein L1 [Candidatus Asgardarchaeia archaeon]